jgi:hypothetical protein
MVGSRFSNEPILAIAKTIHSLRETVMSTPAKELIAVLHTGLISDEAALKQLTTIFNRIACGVLRIALRPEAAQFVSPEFAKNRSMLVDLGILYEPEMEKLKPAGESDMRNSVISLFDDVNEILRPFSVTVEEMLAARNNEEEVKRIRQKTALPVEELAARIADPERLMQIERRVTVNGTRLLGIQLRNSGNPDAYATIPSGDSSLDEDDERPNKHDVLKISVVIPVPDEQAPWQRIVPYRDDPDSQDRFLELKEWMSDLARGAIAEAEAQQKLEFLLDVYRRVLERHEIQINWTKLEAFVVTGAAESQRFTSFQNASPLFSVEPRKLALLDAESTLPGSIIAFVIQAKSMFAS